MSFSYIIIIIICIINCYEECKPELMFNEECKSELMFKEECKSELMFNEECKPELMFNEECKPELMFNEECVLVYSLQLTNCKLSFCIPLLVSVYHC